MVRKMGVIKTKPVRATPVHDIDGDGLAPGSFEFFKTTDREVAGLIYVCPCGCGNLGSLNFRPHPSPSWEWDGNKEAPTLSPSVNHIDHWHGYLRAGVWISA